MTKFSKIALAIASFAAISAAHAIPSEAASGGTAVISTNTAPTYSITATNTCGASAATLGFDSGTKFKAASGKYYYVWKNTSGTAGTVEMVGYSAVDFSITGSKGTNTTAFGQGVVKLYHDVETKDNATGATAVTQSFDDITSTAIVKTHTAGAAQVLYTPKSIALESTTGFSAISNPSLTMTITCK